MSDFETHAYGTVAALKERIHELEMGSCRFNCRNAASNWKQGYIEAQHNQARGVDLDAQEAYKEWRDQKD